MSGKGFLVREFVAGVRDYLPTDARIRESSSEGKPGRAARLETLRENGFYYFDAEAMAALARAVEDLALEEANGHLLAAFQDFKQFEAQRERYEQLAMTIDRLQVIAAGKAPRPIRRLEFVRDIKGGCRGFCALAYQGKGGCALILGRQTNLPRPADDRQFLGFHTFSSSLVARLRQQLLDLAQGRLPTLREFDRLLAIDRATKQIHSDFARQKEALDQAMRRWQVEGDGYAARNLAADLEKEFVQFQKWKTRLPDLLAQAQGS